MTPKAEADNQGLDALYKFLNTHGQAVLDLAEDTFTELRSSHLDEFRQQPRVRRWTSDYPGNQLPFDTEKQRRWWHATHKEPYTRSGRMAANLNQEIRRDGDTISVIASYPSASTKYVLGNILGEQVARFQQRFHAATGWQPAAPKLERHAKSYYDTFVRRYEAYLVFALRDS